MRYLPHTEEDVAEMLKAIGVAKLEDLYLTIPPPCRRTCGLDLPEALTEWELGNHLAGLAGSMAASPEHKVFVGAGAMITLFPNQ